MSDKEKSIITRLSDTFPKLDRENQKYVLGIAEGMAMMASKPEEVRKDNAVCVS